MNIIETFEHKGAMVRIIQDPDPSNPRTEWDNATKMICFHKRYDLGDKHEYKHGNYNGWAALRKDIERCEKPAIIKLLYMLDHSGITISTTPFECPWDSGQIGFVLITKATAEKEALKPALLDRLLESEVRTYDQYLRGDVYGYEITYLSGEKDSCWSYYGIEDCKREAKESVHAPDPICI